MSTVENINVTGTIHLLNTDPEKEPDRKESDDTDRSNSDDFDETYGDLENGQNDLTRPGSDQGVDNLE